MEFDYNNLDNLLINYKYVTGAKKSQTNKLLVKALLQRAVFDKLIELLKDFGSDTNLRVGFGSFVYNDNNDNEEHGFNKQLLDQHMKDIDDLEICWTLNGSAIDPEFMKGQWDYNKIKASAKDKLGAETVWAIETRFDGGITDIKVITGNFTAVKQSYDKKGEKKHEEHEGNDNSKGNGVIVDDDGYLPLPQGNSQTSIDNTDINSNADDIIVEEEINVPTKELKCWKILLFLVSNNV
nr:12888_t:CDS:2 [Entrophospora candida]